MDLNETAAMTEASGLTGERDGIEASGPRRRPLQSPSQEAAARRARSKCGALRAA
jgi:hypothetical protein